MQNRHAYVSQKEINLPSGTVLITKTDTRGVITYCNDAFVAISGYSREELIGKSHNIVRHPDMPAQVFELLWDTLKTDRPWRGLIKNRCKNGDHYWVRSTVAPIIEDGKITGYVSVRKPPSRAQISEAENQYRQLAQSDAKLVSKYERYKFKHWSLAAKLQFLIQSTLLIILSGAQLYVSDNLREESRASAEDKGDQIANEIIDSANMLMITGQISEEKNRKLLLKKIMSSGGVTSAQLVRAPQVVAQFGPGLPEEHVTDDIQRRAIESRQQVVTYSRDENGYPRVRIVTPYVVSHDFHGTDCMTCHNVQDGSVNGASDITIDLKADYQRIHSMEMATIAGQIALHVFMFLFISYITKRFVGRPFRDVRAEFRNIMQGNLDTELDISVRDDTGILLCEIQSMQVYLRTVVDEIVTPVVKIQGSIEGLDARVASVAANAVMEHDHILSIAATMDQFSHSVSDVANMAVDSSEDARAMQQIVEENDSNMQQCILATSQVADTIQSSSRTISELGVAIRNIDSIANTIKEIAEQTNLLALNAAIEAARAGEQGRGFAVVADEVRKLAERTANSTKDISRTIEEIGAISETAVRSMSGAVSEVGIGIDLIRKNGDGLKEIMGATRKVAGRVENISSASKAQANGSQRMTESLDRISSLVDSNAQSANEARVEAQELARSAKGLRTAGYPLTKCAI